MSTTITVTDSSAPAPARTARPEYKVTGRRVLRAEWAKLWSLRSTWITSAWACSSWSPSA